MMPACWTMRSSPRAPCWIIDDIRRSFESTSSDAAMDGGQLLAVHLVNIEGQIDLHRRHVGPGRAA